MAATRHVASALHYSAVPLAFLMLAALFLAFSPVTPSPEIERATRHRAYW